MSPSFVRYSGLMAIVAVGCGGSEANSTIDEQALAGTTSAIGLLDDTASMAVFAEIVDAQLTPGGDRVVVLDAFPPFVRVFRSDGGLLASMAPQGDGPGEVRQPHGLAVSEDGVLVLRPGGITLFGLDGEAVGEARELPFFPRGAAHGCGSDWIVYGPGKVDGGRRAWVHRLRFTPSGVDTSTLYADSSPWSGQLARRVRQVASGNHSIIIYHDEASPATTLEFTCPNYGLRRVVNQRANLPSAGNPSSASGQRRTIVAIEDDTPWFRGITVVGTTVVVQQGVRHGGEMSSLFSLRRIGSATGPDSVGANTDGKLLDASGESVLFAFEEPVPHVATVSRKRFDAMLGFRKQGR